MSDTQGIAIVGMSAVFPGAPDVDSFWRNITSGVDAIGEVPPGRWDPVYYDPQSSRSDRLYCHRGGFVDAAARFDALSFGVMPVEAGSAEPDQLLTLQAASKALADAGYADKTFARDRTGVIVGRGGYLTPGLVRLDQRIRTAQQLVESLKALVPEMPEAQLEAVRTEFQAQLGGFGPDTAIGLVPNLAASRVANRLDLGGPAYTVDAACASALVAVDQATAELKSGRCDLVVVGGVHLCQDVTFWSVFCQLGALSRSQTIRPFDRRADGLVIGEGVGMVVLKRLADAERDADRIYAVIRGTGVASDGKGASLMTPRVDGQVLALKRAWDAAAIGPETVGLVEAHGTATPAGDAAELETLARFFGPPNGGRRPGLGSVKSMIGHAMPAAGIAGLIKAALSVHHGVLPPTLHAEEPNPSLDRTRFRLIGRAEEWDGAGSRRAGVNAFGFGGINAHVVLESHPSAQRRHSAKDSFGLRSRPDRPAPDVRGPWLLSAGKSATDVLSGLENPSGAGPCRLGVLNPTPERIARARAIVERGRAWRGRDDIWFEPEGLVAGGKKIAFLFPGIDARFEPHVDDVASHFGLQAPRTVDPKNLEQLGMGVLEVAWCCHSALDRLGVVPWAMAGHSIGEWAGMVASEMIPRDALEPFVASLSPGSLRVPGVVFAAAGTSADRVTEALRGLDGVAISHDNCPHQVVLCGREAGVDIAIERLIADGVLCQKLSFRSGFHSPHFANYLAQHREHFARLPLQTSRVPLWSATTCSPYPTEPDAIRSLAIDHLVRPVRFREMVEAMVEAGVGVFVQVGAGSLVGFVEDTLRGKPFFAVSANVPSRSGLEQLRAVAVALWVQGAEVNLAALGVRETPGMQLNLGVPLVKLRPGPRVADEGKKATVISSVSHDARAAMAPPVLAEFEALASDIAAARDEVFAAWSNAGSAPPVRHDERSEGPLEVVRRSTISVATMPELVDHCFYPQPPGWPVLSDRHPVVPMTTSIALMMDVAAELMPGQVAVGIERVRANRWIAVEPPVEITFTARRSGEDIVDVSVDGYAAGSVRFAAAYPPAPPPWPAIDVDAASPVDATQLYRDRWMFHGPQYQGVVNLGPMGRDGIRGVLDALPAKGALLDAAGQLMGFWLMVNSDVNRLAMPVKVERVTFHGPQPRPGERVECEVRVTQCGEAELRADMDLSSGGKTWARIEAWEDRRFELDPNLWRVVRQPELEILAVMRGDDYGIVNETWRSAAVREFVLRRYLGERERAEFEAQGPRRKGEWLLGRVAIKDVTRHLLWRQAPAPIFPVEIEVDSESSGRPVVRGSFGRDIRVSVSHKDGTAVAAAREGRDVGVDIERVERRSTDFESALLDEAERRFAPEADRDEWLTRLWTAKESVAKRSGQGLSGNPRRFPLQAVEGSRFRVDGVWVETRREGEFVVGWTLD
jgi:acyl transferase domain-containing protein/phosphopantetheinyl transferase